MSSRRHIGKNIGWNIRIQNTVQQILVTIINSTIICYGHGTRCGTITIENCIFNLNSWFNWLWIYNDIWHCENTSIGIPDVHRVSSWRFVSIVNGCPSHLIVKTIFIRRSSSLWIGNANFSFS